MTQVRGKRMRPPDEMDAQRGERLSLLASIVESSDDAIIAKSLDGIITSWNPAAERIYGYSSEEMIGKSISVITRVDRPDEMSVILGKIRDGQRLEHYETVRVRKDGVEIPVSLTISPIHDADGAVVAASSIARDITDRKSIEAKFEGLLEAAPDAMVGVDRTGMIRFVNRQMELLFGYGRDELVGMLIEALVPESFRNVHPTHRAGYFADPGTRSMGAGLELSGRRRDGTEFPVDISLSSIDTEDGLLATAAVRDITERKLLDKQAHGASEYARSLLEASLDPLVTISVEGKITDVNEATIKVTGVGREGLVGADFSDYFTEPDKAREGYQRVFAEGSVTDYPLTIRHRDGSLTDVLYNASVYRDAEDNVLGVFAAARDITEQKHAQSAIAEQQSRELERLEELERFQRLTVGRELKMIELKKEIEVLRKLGPTDGGEPGDER